MKKVAFCVFVAWVLTLSVVGQRRPLTSANRDIARNPEGSETAARGLSQLRHLETKKTKVHDEDPYLKFAAIYRKHSKEDAEILAPSSVLLAQYASFLDQPNAGIIKLNSDERCVQDIEVVTAVEECSNFRMPGGGTSFSFRYDSYRIARLSDIILRKDILLTDGVGQQGLLVDLGNFPIESLSADSRELSYLKKFKPAATRHELERSNKELEVGINEGGRLYRLAFYAVPDHTFALRSIAFQGSLKRTSGGSVYDEFKFDKRHDVLVVFRIVERDPAGNITIVWKELARVTSPKFPN